MIVNTVALEPYLNVMFNKAYAGFIENQKADYMNQLYTVVPSTKSEEKYGWLGDVPTVQEWIGDKDVAGIKDYDYTVKNKNWHSTIGIDENELEDDQHKMIEPRINQMAQGASTFPMELVAELIRDGDTNLAYDGLAYFANRTVNDNLLAGSGVTLANLKTDLATGRTTMQRFVSDTGKLLKLKPNVIVCPPELEVQFMELINSTAPQDAANYNSAGTNPWRTWINAVISVPELTDTNDWYLFNTTMPLKPFLYQVRKSPTSKMDESRRFINRTIQYGMEMRGNAGYGFPQMGIKFVNA